MTLIFKLPKEELISIQQLLKSPQPLFIIKKEKH